MEDNLTTQYSDEPQPNPEDPPADDVDSRRQDELLAGDTGISPTEEPAAGTTELLPPNAFVEPQRGLLAALTSPAGKYGLLLVFISLVVRLIPAYLVYGSFDIGGWKWALNFASIHQSPYLSGKINWPPLWLWLLLYEKRVEEIYGLPDYFALKLVPCAADAAIALVLFLWFTRSGSSAAPAFRRALWYALNPIPIAACALQGQFESLPGLFTLLAVVMATRTQAVKFPKGAALWLALGGMAKTWPLLLAPAFLASIRGRTRKVWFVILAAAPAVISVAWLYHMDPVTIRQNVINYHGRSGWWGLTALNSWLPPRIGEMLPHALLYLLYAAWIVVYFRTWRRGSVAQTACLGILTFYVFTPGFGPQYTVWVLGIALLADEQRARIYSVVASITLAVMYIFSPFNGELFDFVRHTHTDLFWRSNMNAHHIHIEAVLFLPLWLLCVWWWKSMFGNVTAAPLVVSVEPAASEPELGAMERPTIQMVDHPLASGAMVLAGGASRRMGRDKALLCHNGKTLLQHAVDLLHPRAARIMIVAATDDQYHIDGAETAADLYPGAGPVGGIVTGLRALGPGCHIALACDMPFVNLAVLELMVRAAQEQPEYDAIVPEVNGEMEPLCAVYRDTALPKLTAFLQSGGRSARVALGQLIVNRITEAELVSLDPELKSFTNVNTPTDLAQLGSNT